MVKTAKMALLQISGVNLLRFCQIFSHKTDEDYILFVFFLKNTDRDIFLPGFKALKLEFKKTGGTFFEMGLVDPPRPWDAPKSLPQVGLRR